LQNIGPSRLDLPAHAIELELDHAPTVRDAVWTVNPGGLLG
jgi:hypothetical protein